jgi:hypothetical protein
MPCPSPSPWFHRFNNIGIIQIMKLLILQSPTASYYSLLGPYLLNTLPNTLNFYSSPIVRDQISHPYRTTGKIIIWHILLIVLLDSRREDKIFWTERWQAYPELILLLISSRMQFQLCAN